MPDRELIVAALECIADGRFCADCCFKPYDDCSKRVARDTLNLLKEQENLLGIQQTADSITFISTGTAQQGEERGMMLGKNMMHEWLKKELLHRGLLTNEIRSVFDEAKRI